MNQKVNNLKGFGMLIVVAVIALLLIVATGLYVVNSSKNLNTTKDSEREYTKEQEYKDYENSEKVYETPEPISTDNSFSSIDSDIDNTVIVEEDFSDL